MDFFVDTEEATVAIGVMDLYEDCVIHNDADNPASEIFCLLYVSENSQKLNLHAKESAKNTKDTKDAINPKNVDGEGTDNSQTVPKSNNHSNQLVDNPLLLKYKIILQGYKASIKIFQTDNLIQYDTSQFVGFHSVSEYQNMIRVSSAANDDNSEDGNSENNTKNTENREPQKICDPILEKLLLSTKVPAYHIINNILPKIGDAILSKQIVDEFAKLLDKNAKIKLFAINRLSHFLDKQPELTTMLEQKINFNGSINDKVVSLQILQTLLLKVQSYSLQQAYLDKVTDILLSEISNIKLFKICLFIVEKSCHKGMCISTLSDLEKLLKNYQSKFSKKTSGNDSDIRVSSVHISDKQALDSTLTNNSGSSNVALNDFQYENISKIVIDNYLKNVVRNTYLTNDNLTLVEGFLNYILEKFKHTQSINFNYYNKLLEILNRVYNNSLIDFTLNNNNVNLIVEQLPNFVKLAESGQASATIYHIIKRCCQLLPNFIDQGVNPLTSNSLSKTTIAEIFIKLANICENSLDEVKSSAAQSLCKSFKEFFAAITCMNKNDQNRNDKIALLVSCFDKVNSIVSEELLLAQLNNLLPQKILSELLQERVNSQKFLANMHKDLVNTDNDYNKVFDDNVCNNISDGSRSLEEVLDQITKLNEGNDSFSQQALLTIKQQYLNILVAFEKDSQILTMDKNICDWSSDEILKFAKYFKNHYLSISTDLSGVDLSDTESKAAPELKPDSNKAESWYMIELLAIIKRANILSSGNDPRATQMFSILLAILSNDKGILLQVATGEGKSTITAMLAAYKALQGNCVDVITSSGILAKRDAEDKQKQQLFRMLDLSVSHNVMSRQGGKKPKPCYKADIVYGDVGNFQYDFLYDDFKQLGIRCGREFGVVIVDEVDSMLIDESAKIAMVSNHLPGSEYLQTIYSAMYHRLDTLDKQIVNYGDKFVYVDGEYKVGENGEIIFKHPDQGKLYEIENVESFRKQHLLDYVKNLLMSGELKVPRHLEEFARNQCDEWIKSVMSSKVRSIDKDYVIVQNEQGRRVIAPVDYSNTGVINNNSQWTDGVHQFLQIKSGLKLSSENLVSTFISNMGYFKLYANKIYGMSGTLGSISEQELLKEIYNINLFVIPTYKAKNFTELPATISKTKEVHLQAILVSVNEKIEQGQAVLIICETIYEAKQLKEVAAKFTKLNNDNIKLYSRTDNDEQLVVEDRINCAQIIIATNLAGRGTDIKTTKELEEKGGLHVLVTYLPSNKRVEDQAFGRTSRQGNNGTAELIIDLSYTLNKLIPGQFSADPEHDKQDNTKYLNIDELKKLRDQVESNRLLQAKLVDRYRIAEEDKLFAAFSKLYKQLKSSSNNQQKLSQLEESWGFLLKKIKQTGKAIEPHLVSQNLTGQGASSQEAQYQAQASKYVKEFHSKAWASFNEFRAVSTYQYQNDYQIMQNPSYLVQEAVNNMGEGNSYKESLRLLTMAINLDEIYNFTAYYNRAYALIRDKTIECERKDKALTEYIGEAFHDLYNAKTRIEEYLIPQIEAITVLSTVIGDCDLLKQTQDKVKLLKLYIEHIGKVCHKLKNCSSGKYIAIREIKLLPDYFPPDLAPAEEIRELNHLGLYQIFDVKEVSPPIDYATAAIVGALGVIQIAIGVVCAFSGNIGMATSFVLSGIDDIGKAVSIAQGGAFSWKDYVTEKGIRIALALACMGAEKLASSLGIEMFKSAALTSANPLADLALTVGTTIAANKAVSWVEDRAVKNIEKELRDKITNQVRKGVDKCFSVASFRDDLTLLFALDELHGDNKNCLEIQKTISRALAEHAKLVQTLMKSTLDKLASSANVDPMATTVVRLANTASKAINIVNVVDKISKLTEKICSKVSFMVSEMAQQQGDIVFFLLRHMSPQVNLGQAKQIAGMLSKEGVIVDGRLQKNHILQSDGSLKGVWSATEENKPTLFRMSFAGSNGALKQHDIKIKERIAKFCQLQQRDYIQGIGYLKENLLSIIQGGISDRVKSGLIKPIISEYSNDVRANVTEQLRNIYDHVASGKSIKIDGAKDVATMAKKLLSTRSHPADLDRQAKDLQAKAILATEEQIREQQQELGYDTTQLITADISGINAGDVHKNSDKSAVEKKKTENEREEKIDISSKIGIPMPNPQVFESVSQDISDFIAKAEVLKNTQHKTLSNIKDNPIEDIKKNSIFVNIFSETQASPSGTIALNAGNSITIGPEGLAAAIYAANRALPYVTKGIPALSGASAIYAMAKSAVNYNLNAPEGSYRPAYSGNLMIDGPNSGLFANPIDQMRFGGILPESDITNSLVKEIVLPSILIDPEAGKAKSNITYLPPIISGDNITLPEDLTRFCFVGNDGLARCGILPGAEIKDLNPEDFILSTPILQHNWLDYVFFKDIESDVKTLDVKPLDETLSIIRNKHTGKATGVTDTQKHHIIHEKLSTHELWEKAGMDCQDAANKMLLPTKKGAEISTTDRSIHQGRHLKEVKNKLEEKMDEVIDSGEKHNYTEQHYAEKLKEIIEKERTALKTGKRMLNKNARSWAEPINKD